MAFLCATRYLISTFSDRGNMKQFLRFSAILLALHTSSALALEVTNLDKLPHKVQVDGAGSTEVREIQPGRTEYFVGQPNSFLTLLTAPHPSAGKGVIQSDGILSGIIGNGRTARLPAEDKDSFAIWEGGELALQQRRRGGKTNR